MRHLSADTIHVTDAQTKVCLCHTRNPLSLPKLARLLGRAVIGEPEWKRRLVRIERRFEATPEPQVVTTEALPVPAMPFGDQLGIAGEISPKEATKASGLGASESFDDELYQRVVLSRKYNGKTAA